MPSTKAKDAGFKVPSLKRFTIVDLERLPPEKAEEEAKKLRNETLPELQRDMKIVLTWIDGITEKSREAQELAEAQMCESEQEVKDYLESGFGPFRRTAWVTLLTYRLEKNPKTKEDCQDLIAALCAEKYIYEAEDGSLKIWDKTYSVNEAAKLGEPEMIQLRKAFADLEKRVLQQEELAHQNKRKALFDKGNLSIDEFLGGKAGFFSVWLPEGVLVVKSDGNEASPFDADGDLREGMEKLYKAKRSLMLYTLGWQWLSPRFFTEKVQLDEEEAALMGNLWRYLKQGIYRKKKRERTQAIREEHAADQTITPEEYLFEGKNGTAFLSHQGTFDWYIPGEETRRLFNFFFSVERQEKDGQPAIRLVRCPPWLEPFFSGCKNGKNGFYPEGEEFRGLPQNLGMAHRAVWGQYEKHRQIQAHATT